MQVYRTHNERDLLEKSPAFPGIPEALQELQAMGYRLGVVSSKRQALVAGGLRYAGIDSYFEIIYGLEQSSGHKPLPDPLIRAAEDMGLYPYECIYVGDSPYYVQASQAAGMDAIAVAELVDILKKVAENHCMIIIAHTGAVLPLADRVVVLENGAVSAEGEISAVEKVSPFLREVMGKKVAQ